MQTMLTVDKVCEILDCAPCQVYYWIASGQLTAVRVTKEKTGLRPKWRIAEKDLEAFIESRKSAVPQARKDTSTHHSRKRPILKKYV